MKIGIDFDRVLFDTDRFKEDLNTEFPRFGDTYDQAKQDGFYNLEKHAEIMEVDQKELLDEMRNCSEYLYSDVGKLEELRKEHEVIVVTRGDPVIQKEKLQYSGVLEYVDGYEIITEGTKEVADIDFLVDDWKEELERVNIPGIQVDPDDKNIEKILEHLTPPDFEKVFKRYDIRGSYPEELNESFAYRLGESLGRLITERGEEKAVLTKDPKETSGNLKECLKKGLTSQGIHVIDCGTGPTDYTAFSAVEEESTGVQVSSSHMPLNFNGFKLVYPEGNGFMNEDLDRLKQIFRKNRFEEQETGSLTRKSYGKEYLSRMESFFGEYFDEVDRKVVVENMGGRQSSRLAEILEELGAEVENLSSEKPDINPPDPKPENLSHVEEKVEKSDADLGIATDMDADRVAVYFDGEWLTGDEVFAVLIEVVKPEKVVASIDSTEIVRRTAEKYGKIEYTRVGDPFVIDRTLETDAEFSGEPNGHYCFTKFVPYNSGTLSGLMLAGADLEKIIDELPEIEVKKKSVKVEDKNLVMEKLKKKVEENFRVLSKIDGIKYESESSRVLIRSSGSSHKLRITAEAENSEEAEKAVQEAENLIRNT
ncbi:MAG: phosphoglucosamine mutase [Candidatus Nanohaloarchaea archaeon]|jgi:phosphoglucosamine mutase